MKLRDKIITAINESNSPLCDDCITIVVNVKHRQQIYKRCTELEKSKIIIRKKEECSSCCKFKTVNIISISTNIPQPQKKKPTNLYLVDTECSSFNIFFEFKWVPFLEEGEIEYVFPKPINKKMRKLYKIPSIYRWILINKNGKVIKRVYVGEAQELARRIYFYLKPGGKQMTSIRLNKLFHELTLQGFKISLQELQFEPFKLGEYEISKNNLHSKLVRRFIEHMMASYFSVAGYEMINA